MILDTCVLIHAGKGDQGAIDFLESTDARFRTTVVTLAELRAGNDLLAETLVGRMPILAADQTAADEWGRIYRILSAAGNRIPSNDLWIAAIALAHNEPVVTRNLKDFTRVPDLVVIPY